MCTKGAIERSARRDPHATPPIGPKDVAAGLFSLVNRGLVAAHVDLTPVRAAVTRDGTCELCMRTLGHWRARVDGLRGSRVRISRYDRRWHDILPLSSKPHRECIRTKTSLGITPLAHTSLLLGSMCRTRS